jgi:predicted transcriptional regulator
LNNVGFDRNKLLYLNRILSFIELTMRFHQAFDETLKECGISAKWLAQQANLTQTTISEFRRGKTSLGVENFEKLLFALPKEVQQHFQKKMFTNVVEEKRDIWTTIDAMNTDQLSELIVAIAQRIPQVNRLEKV